MRKDQRQEPEAGAGIGSRQQLVLKQGQQLKLVQELVPKLGQGLQYYRSCNKRWGARIGIEAGVET